LTYVWLSKASKEASAEMLGSHLDGSLCPDFAIARAKHDAEKHRNLSVTRRKV
jgi:hypothetical protein